MSTELIAETSALNAKQDMFCVLYVENKGNGTLAYQEAYDCDYDTAKANASRLLTNANIQRRISALIHEYIGSAGSVVFLELMKLVTQDEKHSVKIQAIKEFNRMVESPRFRW